MLNGSQGAKLYRLYTIYVYKIEEQVIDWDKLYKDKNRYRCSLPTYSFDRMRSWFM